MASRGHRRRIKSEDWAISTLNRAVSKPATSPASRDGGRIPEPHRTAEAECWCLRRRDRSHGAWLHRVPTGKPIGTLCHLVPRGCEHPGPHACVQSCNLPRQGTRPPFLATTANLSGPSRAVRPPEGDASCRVSTSRLCFSTRCVQFGCLATPSLSTLRPSAGSWSSLSHWRPFFQCRSSGRSCGPLSTGVTPESSAGLCV